MNSMQTVTHTTATVLPFKPVDADAERKRLDGLHLFYMRRTANQIRRSLLTAGRAIGPDDYNLPAVCALLDDMIFSDRGAVLTLIDLAQAYERGANDSELAAMTRAMFDMAIQMTACQVADALVIDESAPKRFLPAAEVA